MSNAFQAPLDTEWIVAIQEEIDAMPETLADVVEPELLGRFDGEMGKPCDPTRYYAKLGDVENYLIGFKDAAAILAVSDDYADYMADADFIRHGGA